LPIPKTGPHRGQDNDQFYSSLGLSSEQIDKLRGSKVI
jgi:hypothetical protein